MIVVMETNDASKQERPALMTGVAAAAQLGVTRDTVRRWAQAGELPSVTLPSGLRRYRRADIEAIVQGDR